MLKGTALSVLQYCVNTLFSSCNRPSSSIGNTRAVDTRALDNRAVDARAVDTRATISQKVDSLAAISFHIIYAYSYDTVQC